MDYCSTISTTNNTDIIKEIQDCKEEEELKTITNGGCQYDTKKAKLKFLHITLHFNTHSLANIILSLKHVTSIPGIHINMDTATERASIVVHLNDDNVMKIKECNNGLYYFDTATNPNPNAKQNAVAP